MKCSCFWKIINYTRINNYLHFSMGKVLISAPFPYLVVKKKYYQFFCRRVDFSQFSKFKWKPLKILSLSSQFQNNHKTVFLSNFILKSKYEPDCQGLPAVTDPIKFHDLAFDLHQSWTSKAKICNAEFGVHFSTYLSWLKNCWELRLFYKLWNNTPFIFLLSLSNSYYKIILKVI